jgi:hypothetical protein
MKLAECLIRKGCRANGVQLLRRRSRYWRIPEDIDESTAGCEAECSRWKIHTRLGEQRDGCRGALPRTVLLPAFGVEHEG